MHRMSIGPAEREILRGHLAMGGVRADGDIIAVNRCCVELNGRPLIPITGELQFSRCPCQLWQKKLRRTAGGTLGRVEWKA